MKRFNNTMQRRMVFRAVVELGCHPTPEEIYLNIAETYPRISRATVYRNINALAEGGEVTLVFVPNSAVHVDHRTTPHYHFKCRVCGGVSDVDMAFLERIEKKIARKNGFQFESHEIIFSGLCPRCKEKCSLKERHQDGKEETAEQGDRGAGCG